MKSRLGDLECKGRSQGLDSPSPWEVETRVGKYSLDTVIGTSFTLWQKSTHSSRKNMYSIDQLSAERLGTYVKHRGLRACL